MKTFFAGLIILIFFYAPIKSDGIDWIEIDKFDSSIKISEWEDFIITSPGTNNTPGDNLDYDPDYFEDHILTLSEYKSLKMFLEKKIPYKYVMPKIASYIESNFIKHTKFLYITEFVRDSTAHIPDFLFSITAGGEIIYRFAEFETEFFDKRFGIMTREIKSFNRILKTENLNIENPKVALDIVKLFLTICQYHGANVFWQKNATLKEIKALCPTKPEVCDSLSRLIHNPLYKVLDGDFHIKFLTYMTDNKDMYFSSWVFEVKKNGEIYPLLSANIKISDCKLSLDILEADVE